MNQKIYVVIPAFNEESKIAEVIRGWDEFDVHIVVVDDASSDLTAMRAFEANVTTLRHSINLGQGAALKTGIEYALSKSADYIVTFDADGQHRPQDAMRMVEKCAEAKVDIVLGSRFIGVAHKMGIVKKIVLRLAVIFTNFTTGLSLTDTHNGLRVLTKEAAGKIDITENRMAHASEILEKMSKLRLKFTEYPVEIRYTEYSKRKGQRIFNLINILIDIFLRKVER